MNLKLFFVFAIAIGSWFKFGTLPIWTSGYVNKLGEHTSCVRVIIWIFIDSAPLSLPLSPLFAQILFAILVCWIKVSNSIPNISHKYVICTIEIISTGSVVIGRLSAKSRQVRSSSE